MSEFGVATKAIIFNKNSGKYLILLKSDSEDINPNTFDFPGGRIKFGEKLEEAVKRESMEETGLNVVPMQVFNAWTFVKEDKDFQLTGIDFFCLTEKEEVNLSEEHSDFEWKTANEIIGDEKYPSWLRKTIEVVDRLDK